MGRHKRRRLLKLDLYECILMVVVGLLMGTVFTFGMHHWNAAVGKEEAIPITAAYQRYDVHYNHSLKSARHSIQAVDLHFADHGKLTIDGSCADTALIAALDAIPPGTALEMLVHPHGDTLLSVTAGAKTILAFEDATRALSVEKWLFSGLGFFCYLCAGIGGYYIVARKYLQTF